MGTNILCEYCQSPNTINVGQELLDVVQVTDQRCGISAQDHRVREIRTHYDRRKGVYDQRLTLAAP